MPDLSTEYLGLRLRNPLIVGACKITAHLDTLKQCEAAGAGAVVIHSLFEEEITLEKIHKNNTDSDKATPQGLGVHGSAGSHLDFISAAKEALTIPVIASLNAHNTMTWVEYAHRIESAGADAIELNLYRSPISAADSSESIENAHLECINSVCKNTRIPISAKLSPFYTNVLHSAHRFDKAGLNGLVLFNRLFAPDINLKTLTHTQAPNLSHPGEHKLSQRFIGMLYHKIRADLCANTGIHTADELIKALLCGAQSAQVVSTLYRNHIHIIKSLLDGLKAWMDTHHFADIDAFRGKLSEERLADKSIYRRTQYVNALLHSEEYSPTQKY